MTGSEDGAARLWDPTTGRPTKSLFKLNQPVRTVACSPDGATLLTAGWDPDRQQGEALLWNLATSELVCRFNLKSGSWVESAAFRPDGKVLVTGITQSRRGQLQVWDAATGQPTGQPLSLEGRALAIAFNPDGKTVLVGSDDKTARLWDLATGKPLGPALLHQDAVQAVAFSPYGKVLLTGCKDKTGRLWDVATGKPLGPPFSHQGEVLAVAFGSRGETVLTGSADRTTRLWTVPSPVPGDGRRVALWVQVMTGRELDSSDAVRDLDAETWLERHQRLQEMGGPPMP